MARGMNRRSPAGTQENSPASYRWVDVSKNPPKPRRGERKRHLIRARSFVSGLPTDKSVGYFLPPRRAGDCHATRYCKSRSTNSMPCFVKKTSNSSLNVVFRWCSAWFGRDRRHLAEPVDRVGPKPINAISGPNPSRAGQQRGREYQRQQTGAHHGEQRTG